MDFNTYFAGYNNSQTIPDNQRTYDRPTALLHKISYGRAPLMKIITNVARMSGSYVAKDVKTYWGLEEERQPRIYMTADSASSFTNGHDLLTVSNADASRLQSRDLFVLQGFYTKPDRSSSPVSAMARSGKVMMPELIKVLEVYDADSASDGNTTVKVRRNFGGSQPAATTLSVDYDNSTFQPFLWKALNALPEDSDDQQIYSDTDDEDWNYCQYVMRKWGAGETEENIDKFYSKEGTFTRNGRRTLGEFYDELETYAIFGTRHKESTPEGTIRYAGGFLEGVPTGNWVPYDNTLFNTTELNTQSKDWFYYGSQTKFGVAGADFYTKLANMMDQKIQLNTVQSAWGLEFTQWKSSNGGKIYFANSDKMSLNGMGDACLIMDPMSFIWGHLQNMNIGVIPVPKTNPHKKQAEIYGNVTFKRVNMDACYVLRHVTA